jgi:hypothetical protein
MFGLFVCVTLWSLVLLFGSLLGFVVDVCRFAVVVGLVLLL